MSVSLSDIKPLTNDDPLWTMGDAKPAKQPLTKYIKFISLSDHNDEANNLSQMGMLINSQASFVTLMLSIIAIVSFWVISFLANIIPWTFDLFTKAALCSRRI